MPPPTRRCKARPTYPPGLRLKVATCGLLGRIEEGRAYVQRLLAVHPECSVAWMRDSGGRSCSAPRGARQVRRRLTSRRPAGGTAQDPAPGVGQGWKICIVWRRGAEGQRVEASSWATCGSPSRRSTAFRGSSRGMTWPALLIAALEGGGLALRARDMLVVTSKIVSKAEGRYLDLGGIEPSERARELAQITRKDARLVEAILSEATEVVRAKPNVLIVATRHGLVMANAGIDQSNLGAEDHGRRVLLLPQAPDDSARRLKERLDAHFGADIGVIVSDSVGPGVAARHRRPRHRRGRRALAVGPARREGPVGPAAGGDRGRVCRCGRRIRRAGHGRGGGGPPGRAGARARLERAGAARVGAGPAQVRGPVPMSRRAPPPTSRSPAASAAPSCRSAWRSLLGERLSIIVNTGDDFEHLGLHISPDVDTALYTLAGLVNEETGWGRRDETWTFMSALAGPRRARPGSSSATATSRRTSIAPGGSRAGETLTGICAHLAAQARRRRAHPADDATAACAPWSRPTRARWPSRTISCASSAGRSCATSASTAPLPAEPTPQVLDALAAPTLAGIIICPSNPWLSVEPILARARHARGAAGAAARPIDRRLAHHRRQGREGSDRQDHGRARARSRTAAASRGTTRG